MDGTAVEVIAGLSQRAAAKTVIVEDVEYSTVPLHDPRKPVPAPEPLKLETLSGLVAYIKAERDFKRGSALVLIEDADSVRVVEDLTGHFQQRFCFVKTTAPNRMAVGTSEFRFGAWLDLEPLIIGVQAVFEDVGDRAKVLQLLGNVKDEAVKTSQDDGITQGVTARSGIALVTEVKVPNPVLLAPFRTFAEVEQPRSPFVFRMRKGPNGVQAAFFEADGGAWKSTAKKSVARYLAKELDGTGLLVIA